MGFLKRMLGAGLKDLGEGVSSIIDSCVTTEKEKIQLHNEMQKFLNEQVRYMILAQQDLVANEQKGNWLQRSWRPILMLAFGFIIIYHYFLSQVFALPVIELPEQFWSLLELGIGGYVIGRSVEKVAGQLSENLKLPGKYK